MIDQSQIHHRCGGLGEGNPCITPPPIQLFKAQGHMSDERDVQACGTSSQESPLDAARP
jgi:hypothetical protein